MAIGIISDKQKEYFEFLIEFLEKAEDYELDGMAIVGLIEGKTLGGFWNMSAEDLGAAEIFLRKEGLLAVMDEKEVEDEENMGGC